MKYSRLFSVLDVELGRHLTFSYNITEHVTRPGSTTIRHKDVFVFTVWAQNDSAIPLRQINGSISPTSLAHFEPATFHLQRLGPRRRKRIATLQATVVRNQGKGFLRFDQIGLVQVSLEPDLSQFRIERSGPLNYVRSA